MLEAHLRHAATLLLKAAIRIAPADTRDWGQAMLGELIYIEGPWTALVWALGGSGVLAKHALVSLFVPDRSGQGVTPNGGLFSKEVSMRRTTLITTGGCILAALLLFAAPAFRQAFQLSLAPWHWVLHLSPPDDQSGLRDLARRAEQKHDAEGVAFCAVRIQDDRESARLAEETVRLDPNFLWVYAVVAVRHPNLAEISQWVPRLEQWDPQNALFHMITAKSIDFLHEGHEDIYSRGLVNDPAWQNAMAAAFQSPKYDDYLDRVEALEGKVVPRYGLHNPDQVMAGDEQSGPTFALWDSRNYAKSLLQSGKELEAQGDKKGAIEKYWDVARFGQVVDSQSHADMDRWMNRTLQSMAYQRLQAVYEKDGDHTEATHFAYLATMFDPRRALPERLFRDMGTQDVAQWNALEVTAFGLLMLIFAGCLAVAASILILRRQGTGPNDLGAKRIAAKLVLTGAVGLFLSSAMLYVTYHPYAEILDRIVKLDSDTRHAYLFDHVLKGDKSGPYAEDFDRLLKVNSSGVDGLRNFVSYSHGLPHGYGRLAYSPALDAVFDFWLAVIVIGLIALVFVAIRHFRSHPRASVPA